MMHLWRPVLVMMVMLMAGCARDRASRSADDGLELTHRPDVVLREGIEVGALRLHGISLGDDEAEARRLQIDEQTPAGWLVLWDNNRLRISEGRVVGLGLWNGGQVQRLGINEESDIERLLGKAAAVETVRVSMSDIRMHQYPQRGLSVLWNVTDGRLVAVNVAPAQP